MTEEEIKASSQKKVDAINVLCKQLQIVISAEQIITDQGFIKQIVYYTDSENYNVDKQPVNEKPNVDATPPTGEPPKPAEKPAEPVKEPANPAEAKILEP